MEQDLIHLIEDYAKKYDIEINENSSIKQKFNQLIVEVAKTTNQSVVVLIDEYDKPIINHIGKGEEGIKRAEENRDILKEFYGVLKSATVNEVLRFLLLTGISKFSRVSIFSELNNLNDLTMIDRYSTILGITHDELENYFHDYIDVLKDKLQVRRY